MGDGARLGDARRRGANARIAPARLRDEIRRALDHPAFRRDEFRTDRFGQLRVIDGVFERIRLRGIIGNIQRDIDPQRLQTIAFVFTLADDAFDFDSVQFEFHEFFQGLIFPSSVTMISFHIKRLVETRTR